MFSPFTRLFTILIILITPLSPLTGYERNTKIAAEVWNSLEPHFLPENHKLKKNLDAIFNAKNVTQNSESIEKAKFKHIIIGKKSHIVVAMHPKLKGYRIKFYLEEGPEVDDIYKLKRRVEGAKAIRNIIENDPVYSLIFRVPRKWLYPLPYPTNKIHLVLIAEDMDIYSYEQNWLKWRSTSINPKKLDALYEVMEKAGLWDSVFAFNIPFTKDGKIAFIDTEYYHKWPVPYHKLNQYLSPRMEIYWREKTQASQ